MIDRDPCQAKNRRDLAACLKRLQRQADLSIRGLEEASRTKTGPIPGTRSHRVPLTRSTTSDVLRGNKFPRKDFLLTFVETCGVNLEQDPSWEQAWERLALLEESPDGEGADGRLRQLIEDLQVALAAAEERADQARREADQARQDLEAVRAQLAVARLQAGPGHWPAAPPKEIARTLAQLPPEQTTEGVLETSLVGAALLVERLSQPDATEAIKMLPPRVRKPVLNLLERAKPVGERILQVNRAPRAAPAERELPPPSATVQGEVIDDDVIDAEIIDEDLNE